MSDGELARRLRGKGLHPEESTAIEGELFKRLFDPLREQVRWRFPSLDGDEADEIVSLAMMQCLASLRRRRNAGTPWSLAVRITRYRALDHIRTRRQAELHIPIDGVHAKAERLRSRYEMHRVDERLLVSPITGDDDGNPDAAREQAVAALHRLIPDRTMRTVLLLREEGHSFKEIAQVVRQKEATLRVRVSRLLSRFRSEFERSR